MFFKRSSLLLLFFSMIFGAEKHVTPEKNKIVEQIGQTFGLRACKNRKIFRKKMPKIKKKAVEKFLSSQQIENKKVDRLEGTYIDCYRKYHGDVLAHREIEKMEEKDLLKILEKKGVNLNEEIDLDEIAGHVADVMKKASEISFDAFKKKIDNSLAEELRRVKKKKNYQEAYPAIDVSGDFPDSKKIPLIKKISSELRKKSVQKKNWMSIPWYFFASWVDWGRNNLRVTLETLSLEKKQAKKERVFMYKQETCCQDCVSNWFDYGTGTSFFQRAINMIKIAAVVVGVAVAVNSSASVGLANGVSKGVIGPVTTLCTSSPALFLLAIPSILSYFGYKRAFLEGVDRKGGMFLALLIFFFAFLVQYFFLKFILPKDFKALEPAFHICFRAFLVFFPLLFTPIIYSGVHFYAYEYFGLSPFSCQVITFLSLLGLVFSSFFSISSLFSPPKPPSLLPFLS